MEITQEYQNMKDGTPKYVNNSSHNKVLTFAITCTFALPTIFVFVRVRDTKYLFLSSGRELLWVTRVGRSVGRLVGLSVCRSVGR